MFTVLFLDQSTDIVGFSIFRNAKLYKYGSFKLSDKNSLKTPQAHTERRQYLVESLQELIKKYKINYIVYEDIYATQNIKTAILLAKVQACIESICNLNKIPFEEIKANEWRSYLPLKYEVDKPKREDYKKAVSKYIDDILPELKNEIIDTKEATALGLGWINKQNKFMESGQTLKA